MHALSFIHFSLALALLPCPIIALAQSSTTPGSDMPELMLVGSSRIGDRYTAVLRNRFGNEIRVSGHNNSTVLLAGYSDYRIVEFTSRRVTIRLPESASCSDFPDYGVSCRSGNVLALEFHPVSINRLYHGMEPQQGMAISANDMQDIPATEGSLMQRLQQQAAGNGRRAEIPPGMTLVETPSGFRLVPED